MERTEQDTILTIYWRQQQSFVRCLHLQNAQRIDIAEKIRSRQIPKQEMVERILDDQQAKKWIKKYMLNPNLEPYLTPEDIGKTYQFQQIYT